MPTSFNRRLLLSLSAATKAALIVTALAVGLFIGKGEIAQASYDPTITVDFNGNATSVAANAAADSHNLLDIGAPDLNFGSYATITPPGTQYIPGAIGDVTGFLSSDTFLGIGNGSCSSNLQVTFTMLEASIDNSPANEIPQIPPAVTGSLGAFENFQTDTGNAANADSQNGGAPDPTTTIPGYVNDAADGIPASVNRYPSFINDIFEDVQPVRRTTGNSQVAGTMVTLSFVTFTASSLNAQFDPPHPFGDIQDSMGYITFTILQNPVGEAAPGSITDFCTPLTSDNDTFATTEDNVCRDAHPNPACTDPNPAIAANKLAQPAFNDANDTGTVAVRTPSTAGTYLYGALTVSARDLDGDGFENSFDTCPYHPNAEDWRSNAPADNPDGDGIDSSCDGYSPALSEDGAGALTCVNEIDDGGDTVADQLDPDCGAGNDAGTNDGVNKDGDQLGNPARSWANAGDNCPQVTENTAADSEGQIPGPAYSDSAPRGGPKSDSIGDACDQDDTVANGRFTTVLSLQAVCVGGTDADNDGWCATTAAPGLPAAANDPNDGNLNIIPETRAATFNMPVAHSGSGVSSHVRGNPGVSTGQGSDQCDAASGGVEQNCDAGGSVANDGSVVDNNVPTGPTGAGRAGIAYAGSGQPYQFCNDGLDNDGDGLEDLVDPGCAPANLGGPDTDGDGYTDNAEYYIGTDALGRCEVNTPEGGPPGATTNTTHSTDWPSDLESTAFSPLNSYDKITVLDLTAFLVPKRIGTSPGDTNYNPRFDLTPGITFPFGTWIAVNDLTTLIAGPANSPAFPPMFGGGTKAFGGPACTAHPVLSD